MDGTNNEDDAINKNNPDIVSKIQTAPFHENEDDIGSTDMAGTAGSGDAVSLDLNLSRTDASSVAELTTVSGVAASGDGESTNVPSATASDDGGLTNVPNVQSAAAFYVAGPTDVPSATAYTAYGDAGPINVTRSVASGDMYELTSDKVTEYVSHFSKRVLPANDYRDVAYEEFRNFFKLKHVLLIRLNYRDSQIFAVKKQIYDKEEYLIMCDLEDTGIVPKIYTLSPERDQFYIYMEYIVGKDMKEFLKLTQLLDIKNQPQTKMLKKVIHNLMCLSVSKIHSRGIAHLDLHEKNIIIEYSPNSVRAVLLDFGDAVRKKDQAEIFDILTQSDKLHICLLALKLFAGYDHTIANLNEKDFKTLIDDLDNIPIGNDDKQIVKSLYNKLCSNQNLQIFIADVDCERAFELFLNFDNISMELIRQNV